MNAIDFIKQHGVEKAREVVDCAPWLDQFSPTANTYYSVRTGQKWCEESNGWIYMGDELPDDLIELYDLKRLVESVDLVGKVGGIAKAKAQVKQAHEHGYLTISIPVEINSSIGMGCLYIDKLEKAIADYEAIHSPDIEKREFDLGLAPDSHYVKSGGEHV